ncbi:transducin/WD40 repeat-like superfamily protein [Striga asiatica]|uniref:Transducin/WD40 repeat-like superfamily protein n=1 Tax=Striga asiatica TaxID=4170 RepID=A0A5A7QDJ9_STRAF|nr:transducin/WD40 repeat-like superfamily protein [Striga asiatica]
MLNTAILFANPFSVFVPAPFIRLLHICAAERRHKEQGFGLFVNRLTIFSIQIMQTRFLIRDKPIFQKPHFQPLELLIYLDRSRMRLIPHSKNFKLPVYLHRTKSRVFAQPFRLHQQSHSFDSAPNSVRSVQIRQLDVMARI